MPWHGNLVSFPKKGDDLIPIQAKHALYNINLYEISPYPKPRQFFSWSSSTSSSAPEFDFPWLCDCGKACPEIFIMLMLITTIANCHNCLTMTKTFHITILCGHCTISLHSAGSVQLHWCSSWLCWAGLRCGWMFRARLFHSVTWFGKECLLTQMI